MRALLAVALACAACAACSSPPDGGPTTDEGKLRASLGIPADAEKVIVFSQNAHLDIDWQKTFDGYYDSYVGQIFVEARQILDDQPRAFYSVAEMGFLSHHLDVHPEERDALRAHAARGALRIVGGGVTSPDTLLPESELILRDYLFGARFSEEQLGARATSAWLPDSFGHAATVPDLLAAAGFDSVGFARVDGAPTFFEDALKHLPIKPNSDAAMLTQMGTADFMWRGPGGGEVLAHWMSSGLYCTGDNIDFKEDLTIAGGHLGPYYGDDPTFTDGMIAKYLAEMEPYAKTPYRYVNVGCDFQHPKAELISYLDGWNQRQYSSTKTWAVAAPFDLYMAFVRMHKDDLPLLQMDITPYFMGFYGTRADVKRRVREAARPFFTVETFATALGDQGKAIHDALSPEFERLARADHHDFVTGTANDLVVATEQLPLLDETEGAADAAMQQIARAIAARIPATPGASGRLLVFNAASSAQSQVVEFEVPKPLAASSLHAMVGGKPLSLELVRTATASRRQRARIAVEQIPPLGWQAIDFFPGAVPFEKLVEVSLLDENGAPATGRAVVQVNLSSNRVRVQFSRDPQLGFVINTTDFGGQEIGHFQYPSFVITDYRDQGGLWRLGNEMAGCSLTQLPPAAAGDEEAHVVDEGGLFARVVFTRGDATREAWLGANEAGLSLAITTGAVEGTTRTVRFNLGGFGDSPLLTSLPGGSVERTVEKVYTPTFWPAVDFTAATGESILLRQSTGVRFTSDGAIELMAARDARNEQCDVEGGTGSDPGPHRIEWRLGEDGDFEGAAQAWNRPLAAFLVDGGAASGDLPAESSLAHYTGSGLITAWKPADRGGGVIVRALLLRGPLGPLIVSLPPSLVGKKLTRVDTSERDLEDLGTTTDTLTLDAARFGPIATVRIE